MKQLRDPGTRTERVACTRTPRLSLRVAVAAVLGVVTFACISAAGPAIRSDRTHDDASSPGDGGPQVVPAVLPALVASIARVPSARIDSVTPVHAPAVVTGEATYYADRFEGRPTASGVRFRQSEMYAAHRTFPFGTVLRVTNERNGRSAIVRVVDRGPWGAVARRRNTVIDVSRRAAEQLGFIRAGRVPVRIEVLLLGSGG